MLFRALDGLRGPEEIKVRNLVDAGDGTHRCTALLCEVFAADVVLRVLSEGLARKTPLL
jgi:hypothetical protein